MANQPEVPEDQAEAQALADAINAVGESDTAAELAAANDRLLRLQAEMQNLRNRTSRDERE
jgi:molecular chaperone GrpE (heat shock protein)